MFTLLDSLGHRLKPTLNRPQGPHSLNAKAPKPGTTESFWEKSVLCTVIHRQTPVSTHGMPESIMSPTPRCNNQTVSRRSVPCSAGLARGGPGLSLQQCRRHTMLPVNNAFLTQGAAEHATCQDSLLPFLSRDWPADFCSVPTWSLWCALSTFKPAFSFRELV